MKVLATVLGVCILFGPTPPIIAQTTTSPMAFGPSDSTPVKLRLGRTLSSADAKTGETVDFEVLEEIKIGEIVILARGATAIGTVTRAKPRGRMGKGGKLDIVLDSVRLVSGEKIALRASKDTKGGSHAGAMTGAIVATSIIFFPAAPLFLFIKGKDITIPKGTEITAYVNGDISLDPKQFSTNNFVNTAPAVETEQKQSSGSESTTGISVKSTPDGADIEVDGKFVGSTPSSLQLRVGDHKIVVRMAGFAVWERTITLSSGSAIVVNASLETSSTQATKPVDDKRIPNIATSDKPKAPPNELVSPPQPASTNVKQTQLNPTSPKIIEKVESTPKADDLKTVGKMEAAPPPPSPARG